MTQNERRSWEVLSHVRQERIWIEEQDFVLNRKCAIKNDVIEVFSNKTTPTLCLTRLYKRESKKQAAMAFVLGPEGLSPLLFP